MKRLLNMTALVLLIVILCSSLVGAKKVIQFGGTEGLEHSFGKAMLLFQKEVIANSNGELEVELYPSLMLGEIREQLEAVRMGTQTMMIATPAWLSSFVPKMNILSFPYLFDSYDTAYRTLDGPLGEILCAEASKAGFKILGWWETGFRHVTNNVRPITRLEDFKGLKIRVQGNPVHLATFRALGANPVALAYAEVYTGLQQGVIDGQETSYDIVYLNKYSEVQKYLSDTGQFYDVMGMYMNQRFFDELGPELQQVVVEAANKATEFQRRQARSDAAEALEKLKTTMQVNFIDPAEKARMIEAARTVYKEFEQQVGKELLEAVEAAK